MLKYTLQEGNRFHIREYGKPYKIHRAINILLFPYTHAPRKRGAFFVPILKNIVPKVLTFGSIYVIIKTKKKKIKNHGGLKMKNTIHFETRKSDKVKAHPQWGNYSIWSWMDKFDTNLVNIIKEQEERFYHPETKEWEMPIEACQAIVEKLENIIIKMHENGEVYTIEK